MRRTAIGMATSAGALLLGWPAAAQQGRLPERSIVLTTSANVAAESNVARLNEERAALSNLEQSDVRFSPTIDLDVTLPFSRNYLLLSGQVGYDFYARNDQLNRERLLLDTTVGLNFSNCELVLTGGYIRRRSDLGDLILLDASGIPQDVIRNTEELKRLGADASCGAAIGLRPSVGVEKSWADNSTVFRQFSDYNSTTIRAGLGYRQPFVGDISLFASRSKTNYDNRPLLFGAGNDATEVISYGASFERDIGARLTGNASVAYTKVNPDNPLARDFGGITWSVGLTARFDRLQLVGSLGRSVENSNLVASSYYINKNYSLDATYSLTDRVSLGAGAQRRERQYEGTNVLLGPPLVNEELTSFSGRVVFRQSRRLSFVLDATHEERRSDQGFFDYDNDRIGLSARLTW